jgi:hypothetical protein
MNEINPICLFRLNWRCCLPFHDADGGHRRSNIAGRNTTGHLFLLDRPLFKFGALAMGVGELFGDKMKSAPDRTVFWA